jgi:hypothetical protein
MALEKTTIHNILIRHIGEFVYIVFVQNNELIVKSGILREVYPDYVTLKSQTLYKETIEIEFKEGKYKTIIHFYNSLFVDLLTGKKVIPLSLKIKKSEIQKEIINNLKPFLNEELVFIYNQNEILSLATGRFTDMGVTGITIRLAPFYNSDTLLTYDKILHIYDNRLIDLLKVETYKF